jgi:hypothetical protein
METNPESHTEPRRNTDRKHDTNHSDGTPLPPSAQPEREGNELPKEDVYVTGKPLKP